MLVPVTAVPAFAKFQGTLIWPGDSAYETARKLWNGAIDRRPALIARCAGEDDAAAALAYGLDAGLPISVRGGGHNVAGSALSDGVVIDFSDLRGVEVDPARRTARVQPGALWGDVDTGTQRHGLAVPAGVVSETGVAGLTVGGGFGWLSRRWGLTSDNLIGARLLLADGRRLHVSGADHPDLFWAIRGGGGNFGIITEFEFQLHDLGTEVLAGPLLYRADEARDVLALLRDFIAAAPDELAVYANLRTAPTFDWVPQDVQGTNVVMLIPAYSGDLADGEAILAPLRRSIVPIVDLVKPRPYLALQTLFNAAVPAGWNYYWKSHYLPPLSDAAIDTMAGLAWRKASPDSFSILFHLGGQIDRVTNDHSSASGRGASHALNINAAWSDGGSPNPDVGWCREYATAMRSHATGGVYVNFLDNDEGEARTRAAYGRNFERLARIKARFDPDNVFRSNQNIPPANTSTR